MTIDLTIDPMHPWSMLERFVTLAVGWLVAHTTPYLDMVGGVLTLLAIFAGLMLLFAPESGRHRAGLLVPAHKRKPKRQLALVVNLPHAPRQHGPVASAIKQIGDDLFAWPAPEPAAPKRDFSFSADDTQPVAHHDADTYQPLAEIAAVDTPDAEWEALMARARRELHEIHADDDLEWFRQWDSMVVAFRTSVSTSIAQSWHTDHGRHCQCCAVGTDAKENAPYWREWRIDEHTGEIPRDQLAAAGVR